MKDIDHNPYPVTADLLEKAFAELAERNKEEK